jgi:hypothetical protein
MISCNVQANEESGKAEPVEIAGGVVDAVDEQRRARLIDDPVWLEVKETNGLDDDAWRARPILGLTAKSSKVS